jgi:iron complex outermembrane receptor protein
MDKRHILDQAVRYALMTGAAMAAVGSAATASAANAGSAAHLGKVTVTGTRIKRTNIETAQPITRISRKQIERSGYTNVGQILGRLSFAGAHVNTAGLYGSDVTQVNLRSLGANRNLVLVNDKRWIQGLGGVTNLGTIPTSLIDHIEILQDGASAVYGSDAIAGVINIITIKNFNGAEAHAYYGIRNAHRTGSWDGQIKQYDFTVGSGNNRGNVVFNATYRKRNPVSDSAREITQTPVAGEPGYFNAYAGTPRGQFTLFGPAVNGRTFGQATCGTYDPASPTQTLCDLTLRNAPAPPSTRNFRSFQPTDFFNRHPARHLTHPAKHVTIYVQGHYDLFDNITFTANAAYIRDESRNVLLNSPLKLGAKSPETGNGQRIGVSKSNPYNPFGVDLVADSTAPCLAAGSCIGLGLLFRLPTEGPTKDAITNNDDFHIFAGFNGFFNLFNREIDWNDRRCQSLDPIRALWWGRRAK